MSRRQQQSVIGSCYYYCCHGVLCPCLAREPASEILGTFPGIIQFEIFPGNRSLEKSSQVTKQTSWSFIKYSGNACAPRRAHHWQADIRMLWAPGHCLCPHVPPPPHGSKTKFLDARRLLIERASAWSWKTHAAPHRHTLSPHESSQPPVLPTAGPVR